MKQLVWGIMATGVISRNFAETARRMNGEVRVGAVASRGMEKARAFAEEYQIPRAYGSYEEMLADDAIDVVYIGTPHSHHYENIVMCLEHGKHVLCEKSFTVNADQAEKAYRMAKEKGLFLMEAFWTKFIPVYRDLEKILQDGTIGEIRLVTAQYGFCTGPERAVRKFDPALAGGALLDIGIYSIGFAAMVLGYHPAAICSMVKKNEVGTDDYSSILMQYPDGAIAQLTAAIQTTIPVMGAIYGSKGYIEVPNFKNPQTLRIVPDGGEAWTVEKPLEINGFEYEIREVQKCIAEGKTSSAVMTPEQSIAVMRIMDQIRADWKMEF